MYLIDLKVDATTPINRMVDQSEWEKLFPGKVPRRVYYTFAKGKPVEIDDKIAEFLMNKYPTIRRTSEEIDKLIAIVGDLEYGALKSYGLRYGWSLKDVSITKENLHKKINQALRSYILPMNTKEFEEFKIKRTEESRYRAERQQRRVETIEKNIAMEEKEYEAKIKLTEKKEDTRLEKIRKSAIKTLKKISNKE